MRYIETKFRIFEDKFLSDEDIENQYNNFNITHLKVDSISEDGCSSGSIEIEFGDTQDPVACENKYDNWIRYSWDKDRIAFDHWYPTEVSQKLKDAINTAIDEYIKNKDADKFGI